ncbi:AlpA family phage regulatory protein [Citrobacter koseri]|uniref:AlpA family phage regulatory protein n=1 Tax=Citrobacter koseri TaxID=545 RepID=UPI0028BF3DD3|nr:AlpA family phage regulatory protein [Citrobacter koseri]MDT7486828.1 AlpA family phage regulatory protein [Citrobacter koseri]
MKCSQVYAYMKTGDFPKSIKIGPSSVAWLESEIEEWINIDQLLALRSNTENSGINSDKNYHGK